MAESDTDYVSRNGDHFLVSHVNGVPRYTRVMRPPTPQPNMLGRGMARAAGSLMQNQPQTIDDYVTKAVNGT